MPTYAQLKTEDEWNDQFIPPGLRNLVTRLENYYDPGVTNVGAYGDNKHLRGYHRSRRWIKESRFCTNRSYSTVETAGNRAGGNSNWICGVDLVLGYTRSEAAWSRINFARQHGRIPYVVELLLERDPWHVHMGIDRGQADRDFSDLFVIITGQDHPEEGRVNLSFTMPELRNGAEGADVVTAQALLGARGFETAVDGEFGPHTEEMTRAMQARYGAEAVDGIWGPETWTIAITAEDRV